MKTNLLPSLLLVALVGILTGAIFGFVGYNAGKNYGTAIVYDASFAVGYTEAFNRNQSEGYEDGFSEGISQGMLQGASQVNTTQIDRARNEGFTEGRQSGYNDGYSTGLAAGNRAGIKTTLDDFLLSRRPEIRRELEREGHICSNANICEKEVSSNPQINQRIYSIFNLIDMTHSINLDYISDDGSQMTQRVVVDYPMGTLSAEWRDRSATFFSPFVIYDFQTSKITRNNTTETDENELEIVLSWYNGSANAKLIGDNAGISWVLSANRG